jgi:hypothetical protein
MEELQLPRVFCSDLTNRTDSSRKTSGRFVWIRYLKLYVGDRTDGRAAFTA